MADQLEAVDFALAAYREEGVWQLQEIADTVLELHLHRLQAATDRAPPSSARGRTGRG